MTATRTLSSATVLIIALLVFATGCQGDGPEEAAEALLERSRALRDRATDFDPAAALATLGAHPAQGEYQRLDDLLGRTRVSGNPIAPPELQGFALEFDGHDAVEFRPSHSDFAIEGGSLQVTNRAGTRLFTRAPLSLDPNDTAWIELRLRLAKGSQFELLWGEGDAPAGRLKVDAGDAGEFRTYRIDARTALRRAFLPGERIRVFGLVPSNEPDDEVSLDFLRLIPKAQDYTAKPFGRTHESKSDELREVVYSGSPQSLAFPVQVPKDAPRLRFGMGVLLDRDPIEFSVEVHDTGEPGIVHSARLGDPETWRDVEVDLGRWAGRSVEISLRTKSQAGNIAFWSNPLVYGARRKPMNVIVLLEDTLRADHLSSYGYERPTSPEKDRLAAQGVLFEHAFSQAPTTRPSVPSLMTSLYPSATGVWNHQQLLHDDYLTLAEILRSQGFSTASFVQNSNAGRASGLHQGFEFLFETPFTTGNERIYDGPVRDWVEEHGHRNFLLYLHVVDPHGVYEPPAPWDRWLNELTPGGTPVPANPLFDPGDPTPAESSSFTLEGREARYDGEIRHNDAWLARLVAWLEEAGHLENTLLVMLSDHGEHFREHAQGSRLLDGHHPPGFAQVLRVPLIWVYPSVLPAGRRVVAPVQLIDVLPTLLDLLEVDTRPLLLQGDSLLPLVEGRDEARWRRRINVSEEPDYFEKRDDGVVSGSVIYDRWHWVLSKGAPNLPLFDFQNDPDEQTPLGGRVEEREDLRAALKELKASNVELWRRITGGGGTEIEVDPSALEQLRELGYIE